MIEDYSSYIEGGAEETPAAVAMTSYCFHLLRATFLLLTNWLAACSANWSLSNTVLFLR